MQPKTSWDKRFKNVKGKLFQARNLYEVNNLALPISLFSFYSGSVTWFSRKGYLVGQWWGGMQIIPCKVQAPFLQPEPGLLARSSEGFWSERKPPECDISFLTEHFTFTWCTFFIWVIFYSVFALETASLDVLVKGKCRKTLLQGNISYGGPRPLNYISNIETQSYSLSSPDFVVNVSVNLWNISALCPS